MTDALPAAPDILVVAYRRADLVETMIASVHRMLPQSRILVWDNRSEGTPAMRELAARHPEVSFTFHETNAGFAAGINGLMAQSTAEQVLLLNPDAELLSDLAGCRRLLAADPGVAAAAPWMDSGGAHRLWDNAHREPNPLRQLVTYAGYDDRFKRLPAVSMFYRTQPSTVSGYLTGACLLISRAAWDVVGAFDERYFLYSEETDWCRRARDKGFRLVAVPEPGIAHIAAGTVADDASASSRSSQLLEESRVRYLGDHYGRTAARAFQVGAAALGRVQRSRRPAAVGGGGGGGAGDAASAAGAGAAVGAVAGGADGPATTATHLRQTGSADGSSPAGEARLRILWLAPWFRTLGVAWSAGLRDLGHEVLLITSDMHFEKTPVAEGDLVLSHPWRSPDGAKEGAAAIAAARRFRPDVVVIEAVRDPRFIAAAAATGAPWVRQTHDFAPHDAANRAQVAYAMRRVNESLLERRSAVEVCFSEDVAGKLRAHRRTPVGVVPLTSEMSESLTPDFVPAQDRRDFLLIGRMSAYKNVALAIEAYQQHRASPAYRGDQLVLIGGGDPECDVPPEVQWQQGTFDFADLAPRLAAAKASLVVYSAASQSGVQVTDMQCGTTTLVSNRGGLTEYLPAGESPVSIDGPADLAARFDELADPQVSEEAGRRAREEYERRFSVAASSARWAEVLRAVVRG